MAKTNYILIIEDELITAESISELLLDDDYNVLPVVSSANEVFHLLDSNEKAPALAICDINIAGPINGIDLALKLKEKYDCEIIFLTAFTDHETIQDAFGTKPVMFIVKPYTDKQLLVAVQMAFLKIIAKEDVGDNLSLKLTKREKEIAILIAQGFSSSQIGVKMFISLETVKTHRRNMLQKNKLNNFLQLLYQMNKQTK
ncbi:MAG TPA: DNA-binding response regulator [Pelobium sp.]